MPFEIKSRIYPPINTSDAEKLYGRKNSSIIREAVTSHTLTNQSLCNKRLSPGQRGAGNGVAAQNSGNRIKRRRATGNGTVLIKGQKFTVSAVSGVLKICIGWDGSIEPDASVFMLQDSEKVAGDEWFVFYGQTTSPDNSTVYCSNADDPAAPDDAEISIALNKVDMSISRITICLTIYESDRNGYNFGMMKDLYARLTDGNREIAMFRITDISPAVTSLVVGELYRYKGQWKFCATGSGFNRNLPEFCRIYGVELE